MLRYTLSNFKHDADVTAAFKKLMQSPGFLCIHRKANIVKAILDTAVVPGDIVEIGCNVGSTSVIIQFVLKHMNIDKQFHVYDSFEGLNGRSALDGDSEFQNGGFAVTVEDFLDNFRNNHLDPPIIHQGLVQNLTTRDFPPSISMALIDLDFYAPTKIALHWVWHKMSIDAILVVDDYSFVITPGVTLAVDEFFGNTVRINTSSVPITATIRKI